MTLQWKRVDKSDYAIRSGPWLLSKVIVRGKEQFELWKDGQAAIVGRFDNPASAKAEAERIEQGEGE